MIAVVVTCHNERAFIREAVESALDQTLRPTQVIVVDDGSTDGSIEELVGLDVRVVTITNRGQPGARTAGLLALHPDVTWVAFLDGDDRLAPTYLQKCARHVHEGDVIYPMIQRQGKTTPEPVLLKHPTVAQLWETFPGFGCFMARRALLTQMGGFHPATAGEQDWDFALDARSRGARFAYSEAVYHYRDNPSGYTRTLDRGKRAAIVAEMRRHLPAPKRDAHELYMDELDARLKRHP